MRWRIIWFQTDDAHMRIYAVADQAQMAQSAQIGPKCPRVPRMAQNGPKWLMGPNMAQGAQNCSYGPEIIKIIISEKFRNFLGHPVLHRTTGPLTHLAGVMLACMSLTS